MKKKKSKTLREIHEYWSTGTSGGNSPQSYVPHVQRSKVLADYVNKYMEKNGEVLEIGCNVGRNLNYLYEQGFHNLTGIEISEKAIDEMKKTYPSLIDNSTIINSPVENIIKTLPSNDYDLVFTMAVLEHIHPDSEWIFSDIARITGGYLITVEAEKAENWRLFPRNYKTIFEKIGLKQIKENDCRDMGLSNYTIRIFKKQTQ
ncbi:class I SAM-dependent methyltransferase [Halobacillus sp. K22]|uniref:class I SAM-dependent methyltransferase n=1 Tax=Halobacillus sp. K22 TaxID=3457431 RepID=UPI003FCCB920